MALAEEGPVVAADSPDETDPEPTDPDEFGGSFDVICCISGCC